MKRNISESELKTFVKIGQTLKNRREELGYSYKKVSDTTRISSQYIKSIEAGEYKMFPSPVFVKGFLKNYAHLLNLDPEPFIEEYNKIFTKDGTFVPINPVLDPNKKPLNAPDVSSNPVLFIAGMILIVLVFGIIIYFVYYNFYGVGNGNTATTLKITMTEEGGDSTRTTDAPNDAKVFSMNLRVVAKYAGWIRLNIDGTNQFDIYMDKLRTYRWSAMKSFHLILGKGDLADVYFNEQRHTIDENQSNRLVTLEFGE